MILTWIFFMNYAPNTTHSKQEIESIANKKLKAIGNVTVTGVKTQYFSNLWDYPWYHVCRN